MIRRHRAPDLFEPRTHENTDWKITKYHPHIYKTKGSLISCWLCYSLASWFPRPPVEIFTTFNIMVKSSFLELRSTNDQTFILIAHFFTMAPLRRHYVPYTPRCRRAAAAVLPPPCCRRRAAAAVTVFDHLAKVPGRMWLKTCMELQLHKLLV